MWLAWRGLTAREIEGGGGVKSAKSTKKGSARTETLNQKQQQFCLMFTFRKLFVTHTCGAGRHTRRMVSELACTPEYLGSCTGACTGKMCCLPFMAVRFSPRALALSIPTVQSSPLSPPSGHLSPKTHLLIVSPYTLQI